VFGVVVLVKCFFMSLLVISFWLIIIVEMNVCRVLWVGFVEKFISCCMFLVGLVWNRLSESLFGFIRMR